jgi:hypothetical protein
VAGLRPNRRQNRLLRERNHDPYRAGEKLRERLCCPQCGVQFRNGRWSWPKAGTCALKRQVCPACRRINDDYPAGELELTGTFIDGHRDEILARVHHVEEAERSEHPLNRIMAIDTEQGSIRITTTDVHLPHRIAHALQDAWAGSTSTHYDHEGYFAHIAWERND